ncbi:MAG: GAF domain-containing protein [Anaerolineales bacterium]|nr:GAF domain-containing protein [Anaerolineales bacterium]
MHSSPMRVNPVPHYLNIFPTGHIPVPVCIGDLPLSNYMVSYDTLAEKVVNHLRENPLVPGAVVTQGKRLLGVLPRHKMFERLGRRYGVELFLTKPVGDLLMELHTDVFSLKSQLPINTAAKLALSRSQDGTYDPIVVEYDDGNYALLDMYVLLLSQSQLLSNMNGVISSLNDIETILSSESPGRNILELILESLRLVAPYHEAEIIIQNNSTYESLRSNEHVKLLDDPLRSNEIYRSVLTMSQPFSIEDVRMVPAWNGVYASSNTRSWMGIPVTDQNGIVGLLTLSRFSVSPFNNNEKEMAQVFVRYINTFLMNLARQTERRYIYNKVI